MKHDNRIMMILAMVLVLGTSFSTIAYANSAEPPGFTIMVLNPPKNLSITLGYVDKGKTEAIVLYKEQKAWEAYYRFFYGMTTTGNAKLDGAVLFVQSKEKNFQCPLPAATFHTYNNLLVLYMETESLTIGQPPFRTPLLVGMRIVLTLMIEGGVFFLFGYRKKASWLAFFAINLVTQGALNAMLHDPGLWAILGFAFVFGEILVLVVELIAFTCLVKEFGKGRALVYTVTANAASLALGGLVITYLPV